MELTLETLVAMAWIVGITFAGWFGATVGNWIMGEDDE